MDGCQRLWRSIQRFWRRCLVLRCVHSHLLRRRSSALALAYGYLTALLTVPMQRPAEGEQTTLLTAFQKVRRTWVQPAKPPQMPAAANPPAGQAAAQAAPQVAGGQAAAQQGQGGEADAVV